MWTRTLAERLLADARALDPGLGPVQGLVTGLQRLVDTLLTLEAAHGPDLDLVAGRAADEMDVTLEAILADLDRAQRALGPQASVAEHLERVRESIEQAASLSRQLRVSSGRIDRPRIDVDAAKLARDLEPGLAFVVGDGPEFRVSAAGEAVVSADPGLLSEVVTHLVRNAAAATDVGSITVTVRTEHVGAAMLARLRHEQRVDPGTFVVIEVRDTGRGMAADTAERAVRPLFSTTRGGGGMGLAVASGLARAYGGALGLDTVPMLGTTVTLLLPTARVTDSPTVLVVDDEPMIREVARTMLERSGYRVLLAGSGELALQLYRADPGAVDAVLLDLTMPGMSGAQTMLALRELDPGVCVVVCSGYSVDETSAELGEDGPAGYLQKPYDMRQLSEAVRLALAGLEGPS